MGTKNFKTYLGDREVLTTGVGTYPALNPAGTIVGQGTVPMLIPEDFNQGGSDETAAALRCRDRARALGAEVVFTRPYTLKEPYVMTSTDKLRVEGRLAGHDSLFVGDSVVQVGDTDDKAFNFSISGHGAIDGNGVVGMGIDVKWGYRSYIRDVQLFGCPEKPVHVGETGTLNSSYEIHVLNAKAFNGDMDDVHVANASGSIGVHMDNVTDSIVSGVEPIGYRTGIRADQGSIFLIANHPWNRSGHGPLERCFDIQGEGNVLMSNYADSPTVYNNGGAMGTDCYGYYLHGFNPVMLGNKIFMNTSLTPDASNDNTITAIYMDREVFGAIDGFIIRGGISGTKRYKSYFSGSTGGTTFQNVLSSGANYVVDTASNITVETSQLGITGYHRSAAIHTAYNRFQDRLRAEGSLGLEILQNASNNADLVLQRSDSTAAWIVRKDSSHNFNISRRDAAGAAVDTPFIISNSTGRITIAGPITNSTLQGSTSYADDTAAAAGGVPIGGIYRNGSVVQIRIT
jgi:hypothetical protein